MPRIERASLRNIEDEKIQEIVDSLLAYKESIPDHYSLEGHIPDLLKHIWQAQEAVYEGGPLSKELLRKVGIVVSMANDCPYCTGAYCSLLTSELEGGEDAVKQFQDEVASDELSAFESDVLHFARRVNDDPGAVSDAEFERLRKAHGLSDIALVQLVYQVNLVSGYNRLTTVFDAEYDHSYPHSQADSSL